MFLFSQDQYAGHCEFGGDSKGVKLVVKTPSYFKGKQKLPTPTFELTSAGSIKDGMIAIDQKNAAGDWEAKPNLLIIRKTFHQEKSKSWRIWFFKWTKSFKIYSSCCCTSKFLVFLQLLQLKQSYQSCYS